MSSERSSETVTGTSRKRDASQISTDNDRDGEDSDSHLRDLIAHNRRILQRAKDCNLSAAQLIISDLGALRVKPDPPSKFEMLWWRLLNRRVGCAPVGSDSLWVPLQTLGNDIIRFEYDDDRRPHPEDVIRCIVKCYTDYLKEAFPFLVLKRILEDDPDGVMGPGWRKGKQGEGLLTHHHFCQSIKDICGDKKVTSLFFMQCLAQPDMQRAFGRNRLGKFKVSTVPDIVPYYLKKYDGKLVLQSAMEDIKHEFGYYKEFDWDQFNLGITTTGDQEDEEEEG
jgi:hypothetical protein